jgi:uncharacterized membrane protein YtjA (UPF0391 family)
VFSKCTGRVSPSGKILGDALFFTQINKNKYMLYYALVFLLIAILAGAFGFFGLAGTAAMIAKILFFVFLVLFLVSLLTGRRPRV